MQCVNPELFFVGIWT